MNQEESLSLISQEGTSIVFPHRFINYSIVVKTIIEGGGNDIPTPIPISRINKFFEFCEVMAVVDATPEKQTAVGEARRARQVANQAKEAVKRANYELRNAEATAVATTAPSAAAGGGGSSATAATASEAAIDRVTRRTEEAASLEAAAKTAENAASPVQVISSGNLDAQFASIDPRYRALLDSLIQPVAGGGGAAQPAINGDLLADMIQDMNFLDCKPLLNLFCGFFCLKFLNGKTAAQVRTEWGIVNDFTPAEQAAIDAEEAWLNQ
jgi:hypothetical protein